MLTKHAMSRAQNRAIPYDVMALIIKYGADTRRHHATCYFADSHALDLIKEELGDKEFSDLKRKLRTYVVMSDDGRVITTGYRYKSWTKH